MFPDSGKVDAQQEMTFLKIKKCNKERVLGLKSDETPVL